MGDDPDSPDRLDGLLQEMKRRIQAVQLDPPGTAAKRPSSPGALSTDASSEGGPAGGRAPPGAPRRRRLLVWAGSALLAASAFGAWRLGWRGREHRIPCAHPSALAWQGDSLWISDWHDQAVYRMSKTLLGLRMRRRYSLKGSHIMGMAVAEDALFAVDSWSRQIQRRRLDDQLSLERAWPSPGPNPSALCFDGKYLWSVDKDRRLLYQHALDERLTVLNSYPLEHAPIGISLRKGCFWTVDERARTFYLLRATQQTQAGAFGLAELDGVSAPLSSFSWRGDSLWIGFDGLARLIERPKRRLGRR